MSRQQPASSRQGSAMPAWSWRVWTSESFGMNPEVELARFPAWAGVVRSVCVSRFGPLVVDRAVGGAGVTVAWFVASYNVKKSRARTTQVVVFEVEIEPDGPRFRKVIRDSRRDLLPVAGPLRWFFEQAQISTSLFDYADINPGDFSFAKMVCEADPVPGALVCSTDELDVYRLLGEKTPFLWGKDEFVEWVRGRSDVEWMEFE